MSEIRGGVDELIPGIPNDVTVAHIITKLRRIDVDNLVSVSRGSCHTTIRRREVYDARVRSHSTETRIVVNTSKEEHVQALTLFSGEQVNAAINCCLRKNVHALDDVHAVEDARAFYSTPFLVLPPLTSEYYYSREVPPRKPAPTCSLIDDVCPRQDDSVKCVTLDGKVYVLWGLDGKVNSLDVAGHRQWKQCADMLNPREEFGCGVIAGMLYVHGGAVDCESWSEILLYDRKKHILICSRSIVSLPSSHHIGRERREIFGDDKVGRFWPCIPSDVKSADLLEVYDPTKDEWRVVEPVRTSEERLFVAGGKFYSMSPRGIHIYDFHGNSWGDLHLFSFAAVAPFDPVEFSFITFVTPVNELLAVVEWPDGATNRSCLVQSTGLRTQQKKIVWHKPEYLFKWSRNVIRELTLTIDF